MLTVGSRRVLQGQLRFEIISTLSWAGRGLLGTNDRALWHDDFCERSRREERHCQPRSQTDLQTSDERGEAGFGVCMTYT